MADFASVFQLANRPTVQIESPMESMAKALQLKAAIQQGEFQGLNLQQHRLSMADALAMKQDIAAANGDPEALKRAFLKRGKVKEVADMDKAQKDADKAALDAVKSKHEATTALNGQQLSTLLAARDAIAKAADPAQAQAVWESTRAQLTNNAQPFAKVLGLDLSKTDDPVQFPGLDFLDQKIAQNKTFEQRLKEAGQALDARKASEQERHNRASEANARFAPGVAGFAMPKPPAGYRYTAGGDLEPIPGGPADEKKRIAESKELGVRDATDRTIETGKRLLNHPGLSGAVGSWNLGRKIPGTDAASFAADLDAFRAQNFLPQVQAMKGMGQLSDAEGKKLTDAIGALSYDMKEDDFKASLARIIAGLERARDREVRPNGGQGGDKPKAADPAVKSLTAAQIGALPPAVATAYLSGKKIQGPDGTYYQKAK